MPEHRRAKPLRPISVHSPRVCDRASGIFTYAYGSDCGVHQDSIFKSRFALRLRFKQVLYIATWEDLQYAAAEVLFSGKSYIRDAGLMCTFAAVSAIPLQALRYRSFVSRGSCAQPPPISHTVLQPSLFARYTFVFWMNCLLNKVTQVYESYAGMRHCMLLQPRAEHVSAAELCSSNIVTHPLKLQMSIISTFPLCTFACIPVSSQPINSFLVSLRYNSTVCVDGVLR